jgi:hypothetical protein|tara:strand:+ start:5141 stop:5347 length:207 start_codon:yes stop_codon:yes gene_type:complete
VAVVENLYELYQKNLREYMNEKADFLATGGASSFEEYSKAVGVIQGLALAERELIDLFDALRKGEEND